MYNYNAAIEGNLISHANENMILKFQVKFICNHTYPCPAPKILVIDFFATYTTQFVHEEFTRFPILDVWSLASS